MRNNKLILLVALLGGVGIAAPPSLQADLRLGASKSHTYSTAFDYGAEEYSDVVIAADGFSYLVGSSDGPLKGNYSDMGESKAFVHKVSPTGRVLAERVFKLGGQGVKGVRILDLDATSLLVVLEEGVDATVWTDYRLWRISKSNLRPLWPVGQKLVYRTPGGESFQPTFAASGKGRYVICKRITGWEEDASASEIECYDANGKLIWQDSLNFQYATTATGWGSSAPRQRDTDLGHAMKFAPNGDFLIGGSSNGGSMPRVARYSQRGDKLFEIMLPNRNPGTIRSIASDPRGNAYVLNLVETSSGEKNMLITRISPRGAVLSTRTLRRRNVDYSMNHSYSLAFVRGYLMVLEDTISGIGGDSPHFHVLSTALQVRASERFSFGNISPSDSFPYSINSNGRMVAAGLQGRNAVRVYREFTVSRR